MDSVRYRWHIAQGTGPNFANQKKGKLSLPSDMPQYITVDSTNCKTVEIQSHIGSFTVIKEEFHVQTFEMLADVLIEYTHFLLSIGHSAISIIYAADSRYCI